MPWHSRPWPHCGCAAMINTSVAGHLNMQQQMQLLMMPAAKRKRITGQVVRRVKSASRKRLRQQKSLDGSQWPGRGSKRKMLGKLGRNLTTRYNAEQGVARFASITTGRIAYQQQHGVQEVFTPAKAKKRYGTPDYDAPATRRQARALKAAGYMVRRAGGRPYKPTIGWITENMKQGQAGLILRIMRDEQPATSWVIPLPARSFLGADEADINTMVQTIFNQTINAKA